MCCGHQETGKISSLDKWVEKSGEIKIIGGDIRGRYSLCIKYRLVRVKEDLKQKTDLRGCPSIVNSYLKKMRKS